MKPIHCLNGPNLNLLGTREPEIYGSTTLADIEAICARECDAHGRDLIFKQTNREGELVDWIQAAGQDASALVINAAAYTHTSIAVHDALKAVDCPKVEIHLSNPATREAFRQTNYVSSAVHASIAGLGAYGYELAIKAAIRLSKNTQV